MIRRRGNIVRAILPFRSEIYSVASNGAIRFVVRDMGTLRERECAMNFSRVAVIGTIAWMTAITVLHVSINMGGWKWTKEKETFKVGFLPVT